MPRDCSASSSSLFSVEAARKFFSIVLPDPVANVIRPNTSSTPTATEMAPIELAIEAAPQERKLLAAFPCDLYQMIGSNRMPIRRGVLEIRKVDNWIICCEFMPTLPNGQQLPTNLKFYITPGFKVQHDKQSGTCKWECKNFATLVPQFVEHVQNRDFLLALLDNHRRKPALGSFFARFGVQAADRFRTLVAEVTMAAAIDFSDLDFLHVEIVDTKDVKQDKLIGGDRHIEYRLHIVTTIDCLKSEHEIWRRKEDFQVLYKAMKKDGLITSVPFGNWDWLQFNTFEQSFLDRQREQLEASLQDVCNIHHIHHCIMFEMFLTAETFDAKIASSGKYNNKINRDEIRSRFETAARKEHKKQHPCMAKTFNFSLKDFNNGHFKLKILLISQSREAEMKEVEDTIEDEIKASLRKLVAAEENARIEKIEKENYEAAYRKACSHLWRTHSWRQPIESKFGKLKALEGLNCWVQRVLICAMTPTMSLSNIVVLHVRFSDKVKFKTEFFLDRDGRAYDTWESFLDNNILPYSYIAYPQIDDKNCYYKINNASSPNVIGVSGCPCYKLKFRPGCHCYMLKFREIHDPSLLIGRRVDRAVGIFTTGTFLLSAGVGFACIFVALPLAPIFFGVMQAIQLPIVGYYCGRAGYRISDMRKRRVAKSSRGFISNVIQFVGPLFGGILLMVSNALPYKLLGVLSTGQIRYMPMITRSLQNTTLVFRTGLGVASAIVFIVPYLLDKRMPRTVAEFGHLGLLGLQTMLYYTDGMMVDELQTEALMHAADANAMDQQTTFLGIFKFRHHRIAVIQQAGNCPNNGQLNVQ